MSVVAATERAVTSGGDAPDLRCEFGAPCVVLRGHYYFSRNAATTGWLIPNRGHSAGVDRWCPIDLKLMLLLLLPLPPPISASITAS
jgi:hypothetical protein